MTTKTTGKTEEEKDVEKHNQRVNSAFDIREKAFTGWANGQELFTE